MVWEPILWTDLKKPSKSILARLSGPRVVQFWDPDHSVARELKQALSSDETEGINRDQLTAEILWDDVVVYQAGQRWTEQKPSAAYFDGPVYKVISRLREILDRPLREESKSLGGSRITSSAIADGLPIPARVDRE